MHTIKKDKNLQSLEKEDFYFLRVMYFSGIYLQGVFVNIEIEEEEIVVNYAPLFKKNSVTTKDLHKLKEAIWHSLLQNNHLRIRLLLQHTDFEFKRQTMI